ncbi:MAG TPA: hypothetical protein VM938_07545 [Acidimicrobiales bacterium]|nr:hypothetical protein [Acidimicrobiales bacterium]
MAAAVVLDDRQQRWAYLGAAVAAAAFVGGRATQFPETVAFVASAIGLVLAGFLWFAARRRSVVMTGLASFLISFGPWTPLTWMLGAVYIAAGGLLMYRASKQAAATRAPREPRRPRKEVPEAPAAKRAPEPSKRYTPPKR